MLKPYPKYKDSSVAWIGEIPEGWEVKRLKYLGESIIGVTYHPKEIQNNGTLVLRSSNIQNGKLCLKDCVYLNKEIPKKLIVKKGDILICSRNGSKALIGKNITIDESIEGATFGAFMTIFRTLQKEFISKYFNSQVFKGQSGLFFTSTINQLTVNTLNNSFIALPPKSEQKTIATYLDKKTKQIDTLIENKEKMIELLKEKRAAVINHAVTKGLDPNAKMKDSGVEWIGEIPEGWGVKRLKHIALEKLMYGANESAELNDKSLPRYIRITDFGEDGNLKNNTFRSLPREIAQHYLLQEGDILFARSGATVGKTFQFKNYKGQACFAGYLIKIRPDEKIVLSNFLYYVTRSNIYENWKNSIFCQATIQNIGADKYNNFALTFPNISFQKIISTYLDKKTKQIDLLIEKEKTLIDAFKEYRTALISEAVTGKIDLRSYKKIVI